MDTSGLRRSARLASKTPNPKRSLLTQKIAIAKGRKSKTPAANRQGNKAGRAPTNWTRAKEAAKTPKRVAKVANHQAKSRSPRKRRAVEEYPTASGSSSSTESMIQAEYIPQGKTYDLHDGTFCYLPPGQPADTIMRRRYAPSASVWTGKDYARSAEAQVQPQPLEGVRRDQNPYVRGESVASQATDYITSLEGWQSHNFMYGTPQSSPAAYENVL
ncbi:hypothetical protein BKA70DRAFT_1426605 [Coprinopsis sp. MPI-PUGE-AT-0042]|nr:hypothetical protein BKA70DRAFT_1426605 [Coprinopsis sp. MPI-PUGE-AT-0042]